MPLKESNIEHKKSYFGFLKGTIEINDDIVNYSFESDWEANND